MSQRVQIRPELLSPFAWDRYLQRLELHYYDLEKTVEWSRAFWPWVFVLSFVYVALCFLGVRYMRDREKFQLRRTLVLWNTGLAVYSMFSLWRMLPSFVFDISEGRYADIACSTDYYYHDMGPWAFLFPFSKIFEFGDTLFVVLKKKQLIFLHWYHHITVLWFCWYSLTYPIGPGRMFAMVNLFVHSVMYTYYGVVASGLVRLPRWINVAVTSLQIMQMFVGIFVNVFAYVRVHNGQPCAMELSHFALSTAMYASYMVLFGNYFYKTYVVKKQCVVPPPPTATPPQKNAVAIGNGSNGGSQLREAKVSNGANGHRGNGRVKAE